MHFFLDGHFPAYFARFLASARFGLACVHGRPEAKFGEREQFDNDFDL